MKKQFSKEELTSMLKELDKESWNNDESAEDLVVPKYPGTVQRKQKQVMVTTNQENDFREDSIIKPVNYRKTGSKLAPAYWFKRIRLFFKEDISYLINMELSNGMFTTFVVQERESGFKFNGKKYCFDDSLKYYHLPSGLFAFNYHEGFAMPILAKIDLNEINKAVAGSGITEIEYMTNPATLERFTVSKIAEGIMKGQQLEAFFKQIRLLMVICVLEITLLLILFVIKSGMLKQIHIPGVM